MRRGPRPSPSVLLAGSSLLLRGGQSGKLLLPPIMPLLLGDGHGAGRNLRNLQAGGRPQAHSFAINTHPARMGGPGQRGELAGSSGGREVLPGGSITLAGTALNRALTRGARTSARAALGVDTPTARLLRERRGLRAGPLGPALPAGARGGTAAAARTASL